MTPPPDENVTWLMGRSGGVGLVPMVQDYAGHLLLVLGDPAGRVNQGTAWMLTPGVISQLRRMLDKYEETGVLSDPAAWPQANLWGVGAPPIF